jgi:hypothetical protein
VTGRVKARAGGRKSEGSTIGRFRGKASTLFQGHPMVIGAVMIGCMGNTTITSVSSGRGMGKDLSFEHSQENGCRHTAIAATPLGGSCIRTFAEDKTLRPVLFRVLARASQIFSRDSIPAHELLRLSPRHHLCRRTGLWRLTSLPSCPRARTRLRLR